MAPTRRGTLLRSIASLLSVVTPGLAVCLCLFLARDLPRYAWVRHPDQAPWELWAALVSGVVGTTAGVVDWIYHRVSGVHVTAEERKIELLGLAGAGSRSSRSSRRLRSPRLRART